MEGPRIAQVEKAREKTFADQFEAMRAKNQARREREFSSAQEATPEALPADLR